MLFESYSQMGFGTYIYVDYIRGVNMLDMLFDVCILFVAMGVIGMLFGLVGVLFSYADAHVPAFHRLVSNMIGEDDDEWEEREV